MTKLFLIRHGQTDLNRDKKYCGVIDIDLNEEGRRQAQKLISIFDGLSIDAVYSSDLKRTLQTAQIIFKDRDIVQDTCWREMNFGILEGLGFEEIINQYPDIYNQWITAPWEVTLKDGESFNDLYDRVRQGLALLVSKHKDKQVVIVSHGGPIRVVLCEALGLDKKDYWFMHQDNAALNIIEYHEGVKPKVVMMNNTGHL